LALLRGLKDTSCDFGVPKTVQQLFVDSSRRYPTKTAVYLDDVALSYAQLLSAAFAVMKQLQEIPSFSSDSIVCVCTDSVPNFGNVLIVETLAVISKLFTSEN
jgi:non-ribosomal peptide synthetase component E (peptide arylation enzyme)